MTGPLNNRFENYQQLRSYFRTLPAHGSPFQLNAHTWVLSDYKGIRQVLNDSTHFKAYDFRERLKRLAAVDPAKYAFPAVAEAAKSWLIFMEGEQHLTYKRQLHKMLYALELAPIIRDCTDALLDELAGLDHFDLMTDFCDPLISRIVCVILGIDQKDYQIIRSIAKDLLYAFEPFVGLSGIGKVSEAHTSLVDYLQQMELDASARRPGLFQELQQLSGEVEIPEAIAVMEFVLFAGVETSTILLCDSLYRLLTDLSHEVNGLATDNRRDLVIEELIRMGSATSFIARVAVQPVSVGEVRFKEGDFLLLSLAAANRDPAFFPHPDIIHEDNLQHQHLAFGSGRHYCLGTTLSRLEMQYILPAFFKRFGTSHRFEQALVPVISHRYFLPGIEQLLFSRKTAGHA